MMDQFLEGGSLADGRYLIPGASETGDASAQYKLAKHYRLTRDYTKATYWLHEAAKKGYAKAQYMLGGMYQLGNYGVSKDAAKAAEWYQKAAEQGNVDAQYYLGILYILGEGDLRDRKTGCNLLRVAIEQKDKLTSELTAIYAASKYNNYCIAQKADSPRAKAAIAETSSIDEGS